MDKEFDFIAAEAAAELVHNKFEELLKGGFLAGLEPALKKAIVGAKHSQSLTVTISLASFDSERGEEVMIHELGRSYSPDGTSYDFNNGESLARYISDGKIITIPHSHCPNCWAVWDFKPIHPECTTCGFKLGEKVKYLIDDNICPWCGEGEVTPSKPECDNCGNLLDERFISWG